MDSVIDVRPILDLIGSQEFKARGERGDVKLSPPLRDGELRKVAAQLTPAQFDALLPLLKTTSAIEFYPGQLPDPGASIDFYSFEGDVWSRAYPRASVMGFSEEMMYWDIAGDPPGWVFYVNHEGPWHRLSFFSLTEAISFFLETSPDEWEEKMDRLNEKPRRWPKVGEFVADDEKIKAFLAAMPKWYTVHDFRQATPGDAFPYNDSGPEGITRCGALHFWVQRQPKNWLESVRWWWSGKTANLPEADYRKRLNLDAG
jgi:hypothetical protein